MTDVQQYRNILSLAYDSKELTQDDFNDTLKHFERLIRLEEQKEFNKTLSEIF